MLINKIKNNVDDDEGTCPSNAGTVIMKEDTLDENLLGLGIYIFFHSPYIVKNTCISRLFFSFTHDCLTPSLREYQRFCCPP